MTYLYWDACAWVKRYFKEVGSETVESLFSSDHGRICSVLGVVEVVAAASRKHSCGDLNPVAFQAIVEMIESDWRTFLHLELTLATVPRALDVARTMSLRGADAVHFAAFQSMQHRLRLRGDQLILVTSDNELIRAAHHRGFDVIDPTDGSQRSVS